MNSTELKFGIQSDLSVFADTLVEMTWEEVRASGERGDSVIFPIAVVEAHGPHMDLSPDIYYAYLFSRFLKNNLCAKGINTVIVPPYYWGINSGTGKYPGSFTVRPETFNAIMFDIFSSLKKWGFSKVFIVNAHGDEKHTAAIEKSINEIKQKLNMQVYRMDNLDIQIENKPDFPDQREDRFDPDIHAGSIETATMYAFYPQKVRKEIALKLKPQKGFDPLAYCGDPASFVLEKNVIECFQANVELDSLKIETILNNDKNI
ncbi:creatininase family protein [Clostridium saccharoperbutylacetonicum]|uniref:creatininase family protein n=1 Tax=Clostridium saccharoperbutylacetonicum TaxID=36745 RepID=UPI0039EC507D